MSTNEAKKIVRRYVQKLRDNDFKLRAVYLFGSHAYGRPNKWSDIDVAVVFDQKKNSLDKDRHSLWNLRMGVDMRIEPHGFLASDFYSGIDPMSCEVKKMGIRVV